MFQSFEIQREPDGGSQKETYVVNTFLDVNEAAGLSHVGFPGRSLWYMIYLI